MQCTTVHWSCQAQTHSQLRTTHRDLVVNMNASGHRTPSQMQMIIALCYRIISFFYKFIFSARLAVHTTLWTHIMFISGKDPVTRLLSTQTLLRSSVWCIRQASNGSRVKKQKSTKPSRGHQSTEKNRCRQTGRFKPPTSTRTHSAMFRGRNAA